LIAHRVYNFQAELENHKEPDWQGAIMGLISEVFLDNPTKGFFPRTNGVTRIVTRLVRGMSYRPRYGGDISLYVSSGLHFRNSLLILYQLS
jgi:hypothetical protein